jgi:hypothetical protein
MSKSLRNTLLIFVAAVVLTPAISSAALTAQATETLQASPYTTLSNGSCQAQPTKIRLGLKPVWVELKIKTKKGVLVRGIGLIVRRYVSEHHAVDQQPGVFSGCWVLLTYKPNNVPKRLCITVNAGLTAPDGACQPVVQLPTGQRSASFTVLSP